MNETEKKARELLRNEIDVIEARAMIIGGSDAEQIVKAYEAIYNAAFAAGRASK